MSLDVFPRVLNDDDFELFPLDVVVKSEIYVPFIFAIGSACRLSDHKLITVLPD